MKKFLSMFLAIVVSLSSLALPAFAAEPGNVAKIGDSEYATLAAAVTAANLDSATVGAVVIELIDDTTISAGITIKRNITIDGNGKNYNGTMAANAGLTVTVQNVNFVNGGFAKNTKTATGNYTIKNWSHIRNY